VYDAPVEGIGRIEPWRSVARIALVAGIHPDELAWREADQPRELHATHDLPDERTDEIRAPATFVDLARTVICHRSHERYGVLYRLLWRLRHEERGLLQIEIDPDVRRARDMAKSVRRDIHKMRAFVRFRRIEGIEPEHFVAWFEPDHHIVDANAPFFQRRFAQMRWSILTPGRSARWTGDALQFGPGANRADAPDGDRLEDLWRTYYGHIFNPARLKIEAMRTEMPKKYWKNLPEAEAIHGLVQDARQRVGSMVAAGSTEPSAKSSRWIPAPRTEEPAGDKLATFNHELAGCERCELHQFATQAVPGEGPVDARLMVIGEQPGDEEDLRGRPFVGPAGRLLDELFVESGIERERAYLTNAIKHFRFQPRGKRRMHQRPDGGHMQHCRWWLEKELALVRPTVIVALGTTAARSLLRRPVHMADVRGQPMPYGPAVLIVTFHPSYLLRLREPAQQADARADLLADLRMARHLLAKAAASAPITREVEDLRPATPARYARP
jgi:probable DNA metabolism protein